MQRYLTLLYACFFLVSHSLSADGVSFDCSVATELPVIITERCQEYIVDRSPASNGPEIIKVTACPIEIADPEDKTVFVYTSSPNWPVWMCRNKKEREGLQQPEAPTLTITVADGRIDVPDHEIPAVSGGGGGDVFFDDKRPRKPGMPAILPVLLETVSAGWLPAGLMPFALGLELPELSDNSPVLFQQGVMSDDSGLLVVMSGTQQRIYRKRYQLGDWHLAGQTDSKALPFTGEEFDDFITEDKLVRALVGVFGWAGKDSIPIYQTPLGTEQGRGASGGRSESTGGSAASGNRHSAGGSTEPLQRQHQDQGGGGGGERNPTLIEQVRQQPDLLRKFVQEALSLLNELNKEERFLSYMHLLAGIYLGDMADEKLGVSILQDVFKKNPEIAVRWLTVVARLFPDIQKLNSGFLSNYKEILSNTTFPRILNQSITDSRNIVDRFKLLKHCTISNQFVLELCHHDPWIIKEIQVSPVFRIKEAEWRKKKSQNVVWPLFVDCFGGNNLWEAFEYREVEELNSWLAILSQILQQLRDTGQDELVNLMLVGLGPEDREAVLVQMKSMAEGSAEMVVDQSVDWWYVAKQAIMRKKQLEARLGGVQRTLPRTVELADETAAQLQRLTSEKKELQELVRVLLEEKQSTQTIENKNLAIMMTSEAESSQVSSEELKACLQDLQTELKATKKELRETEAKMMCSVCQDTYTEPHMLPCYHMYCKECIDQITKNQSQPPKCPRCKKIFLKEETHPAYP